MKPNEGSEQDRFTRRDFLKTGAGAALGLTTIYLLGCAPAAPTPTATPTKAPVAVATPTLAPPTAIPTPKPPTVVTHTTTAAAAGLLDEVIKRQKLDEKYGIKFNLQVFDPAGAEQALMLKKADTGLAVPLSTARANLEGVPLIAFAAQLLSHVSIIVWKDSPYQKFEDLKGKKFGTFAKVTAAYGTAHMLAAEKGMNWEKDFELVTGVDAVIYAWLDQKQVEATLAFEPGTSKLLATGKYKSLGELNTMWKEINGVPIIAALVGTHKEWLDKNKETAKAITKVFDDATKYVGSEPKELRDVLKTLFKVDDEKALDLIQQRMPQFYKITWDDKLISNTKEVVKLAAKLGIIADVPKNLDDIFVRLT